jgi:hypothetical protein
VYSNSTLGAAAHCYIDVVLQAMDLAIPPVPLDSTHSPTVVFMRLLTVWGKVIIFVSDKILSQYYYSKLSYCRDLLELHLSLTHLTGITV